MKKAGATALSLALLAALATPAQAAPMAVSCARLLGISSGEAGSIYYAAEADLGTETANRLWGAYHRLRSQCATRPSSRVVVDMEPRVKAFLEAYR
jgi:hypothetical protein